MYVRRAGTPMAAVRNPWKSRCANNNRFPSGLEIRRRSQGFHMFQLGVRDSRFALDVLTNVIRRMSALPGTKSMVLVSQGFLLIARASPGGIRHHGSRRAGEYHHEFTQRARTVYGRSRREREGHGQRRVPHQEIEYIRESQLQNQNVLAELAAGTGGTYFHNNNDLGLGFRRVASPPEFVYILGFSPRSEKLDGSYHTLRVTLRNSKDLTLEARQGYFAPSHAADAQEEARAEIQDALFSRDELAGIPVEFAIAIRLVKRYQRAHSRDRPLGSEATPFRKEQRTQREHPHHHCRPVRHQWELHHRDFRRLLK